jgi:DNA polymerase III subunit epsilon
LPTIEKMGLILDVETTGLSPTTDEVIELAVKLFSYRTDTGEITDIKSEDAFLREPLSKTARSNYNRAYRIHGIPFEAVEGKTFHDIKIKKYLLQTDAVFAHNASFDRSFLYYLYPEVNELNWYCTMRNVPWKTYGFPNGKLLTLLQMHNITNHQTHRAMDDITYLMDLLKKTSPKGNLYIKEVLETGPMRKYSPATSRTQMGS